MIVYIPTPLRSYTAGASSVPGAGASIAELLADLDRRFPGIRFRMIDEQDRLRRHMRIFINGEEVRDLAASVAADDEVHILQALSGG